MQLRTCAERFGTCRAVASFWNAIQEAMAEFGSRRLVALCYASGFCISKHSAASAKRSFGVTSRSMRTEVGCPLACPPVFISSAHSLARASSSLQTGTNWRDCCRSRRRVGGRAADRTAAKAGDERVDRSLRPVTTIWINRRRRRDGLVPDRGGQEANISDCSAACFRRVSVAFVADGSPVVGISARWPAVRPATLVIRRLSFVRNLAARRVRRQASERGEARRRAA